MRVAVDDLEVAPQERRAGERLASGAQLARELVADLGDHLGVRPAILQPSERVPAAAARSGSRAPCRGRRAARARTARVRPARRRRRATPRRTRRPPRAPRAAPGDPPALRSRSPAPAPSVRTRPASRPASRACREASAAAPAARPGARRSHSCRTGRAAARRRALRAAQPTPAISSARSADQRPPSSVSRGRQALLALGRAWSRAPCMDPPGGPPRTRHAPRARSSSLPQAAPRRGRCPDSPAARTRPGRAVVLATADDEASVVVLDLADRARCAGASARSPGPAASRPWAGAASRSSATPDAGVLSLIDLASLRVHARARRASASRATPPPAPAGATRT